MGNKKPRVIQIFIQKPFYRCFLNSHSYKKVIEIPALYCYFVFWETDFGIVFLLFCRRCGGPILFFRNATKVVHHMSRPFYRRRSRQIKARKVFLLLLWGHISFLLKYSFWDLKSSKLFLRKRGVKIANFSEKRVCKVKKFFLKKIRLVKK